MRVDPSEIQLSDDLRSRVADLAEKTGKPWRVVLEQAIYSVSIDDLVTPVRAEFLESGMTDDELGDFLEEEKHAARKERRAAGS
jgi:predicted transcriptional regulator